MSSTPTAGHTTTAATGTSGHYTALVCRALSDNLSGLAFEQIARRPLAPDEIRVRMRATALGFPDLLMTRGLYQVKPPLPYVPGMESCAEIIEIGAQSGAPWPCGQRVIVSGKEGALAHERIVRRTQLRPVPEGLSDEQAAALTSQGLTAYVSLVRRGQLERGETLLVHGASGGVGLAAVRLGAHLGARVIATGSSAAKLAVAAANGAHETVDLSVVGADGLRDRIRELTADKGVDVVFDPVGGDLFDASIRCLVWGGRLVVVGFASGRIPSVAANQILIRGISVIGVRAGEYGRRDPVRGAENIIEVDRLARAGVLLPHIGLRLPLLRAIEGFEKLAARQSVGRIVVTP